MQNISVYYNMYLGIIQYNILLLSSSRIYTKNRNRGTLHAGSETCGFFFNIDLHENYFLNLFKISSHIPAAHRLSANLLHAKVRNNHAILYHGNNNIR